MTSLTNLEQKAVARMSYGERVRPTRDWLTLLSIAALLFIASAAWNVWLYYRVLEGPASGNASAPTLDTAAVTNAKKALDARAAEEAKYEHGYSFVDPSHQ
jgi:hypothetical protein